MDEVGSCPAQLSSERERRWDADANDFSRGHGTLHLPPSTIISTLSGTLHKTNKLLSVHSLSPLSPYTPEIGDLVVGRILEVQSKRWKVDINAHQSAALLLSSINLPGGILRRRTNADELQIRTFFSEGDVCVAEVQSIFQDGAASLHTRSLKYGKLKNGWFVKIPCGGVVRSKSHVWTIAANGGDVDVIVGVNGYVWIAKRVPVRVVEGVGEEVSEELYSGRNMQIENGTRREIARIGECIKAIVGEGYRVEEGLLNAVYESALDGMEDLDEVVDVGPEWAARVVSDGLSRLGR